jgi:hypothetical protein
MVPPTGCYAARATERKGQCSVAGSIGQGKTNGTHLETAPFGAGCFWGVEENFKEIPGGESAGAGYLCGTEVHPFHQTSSSSPFDNSYLRRA